MRQNIWLNLTMQIRERYRGMELEEQERRIRNEYLTVLKIHHDNRAIDIGTGRDEAMRWLGGRGWQRNLRDFFMLDSWVINHNALRSRPAGLQTSARRRQLTSVGIFYLVAPREVREASQYSG
jgi:hypothetical protein